MSVKYKTKNIFRNHRKAFSLLDMMIVFFSLIIIFVIIKSTNSPKIVYYNSTLADIDVSKNPEQSVCYFCKPIIKIINKIVYRLTPVANYKICGMVLAKNTFFMDEIADIAPIDIGLAWAKMTEPEYDKYMNYRSSNRFLDFSPNPVPEFISFEYLNSHVSHSHIIPSNDNVFKAVNSFRNKEKICLEGYLVNIKSKDYFTPTSVSRTDTAGGACEIIYVMRVRIGNNFYE